MVEEVVEAETKPARLTRGLVGVSQPRRLKDIRAELESRMPLQMEEFARVLGGGIVPGSIVLIGGDPGIGKSTLTLQMAMQVAQMCPPVFSPSPKTIQRPGWTDRSPSLPLRD